MTTDTRIVYGARCGWWGKISEVATKPSGLPCCPHCGGVLFEVATEDEWWEGVRQYTRTVNPDYRLFVIWLEGKHFDSLDAAREEWARQETTE